MQFVDQRNYLTFHALITFFCVLLLFQSQVKNCSVAEPSHFSSSRDSNNFFFGSGSFHKSSAPTSAPKTDFYIKHLKNLNFNNKAPINLKVVPKTETEKIDYLSLKKFIYFYTCLQLESTSTVPVPYYLLYKNMYSLQ